MKRFFSALLAVAMLTAFAWVTPVFAAGEVTFTVGSATGKPGDSIQIPITVSGNPGISLIQIDITLGAGLEWDYDPALYGSNQSTWPFISSSDVLPLSTTRPQGANFTASTARLLFQGDGGNVTTNGTLVTLKLKVKGDATSSNVSVSMSVHLCIDETDAAVPNKVILPIKEVLPTLDHKVAGAKVGYAQSGLPINFSLTLGNYPKAEQLSEFGDYALITYVTLGGGLTFEGGSVSVKIDGVSFEAGMYTVSTTGIDGATFKVVIPIQTGGDYPTSWGTQLKGKVESQEPIVIEYRAALNASAVVYDLAVPGSFNTSTAILHYNDDPDNPASLAHTVNSAVGVYTFKFDATKVDSDDHSKLLSGAVFELRDSATGSAIPLAKSGNVYRLDPASTVTSITTDASGKFIIEGLSAPQDYYLVETKAPDDYDLPDDPAIKVRFNAVPASSGTTLGSLTMSVNDTSISGFSIMIENGTDEDHDEILDTGGMGTMLFTVGGAVLMAAAFVLFMAMRKRRMRGMA